MLHDIHRETGWRVRALTFKDPSAAPSVTDLREAWKPDKRTVVLQVSWPMVTAGHGSHTILCPCTGASWLGIVRHCHTCMKDGHCQASPVKSNKMQRLSAVWLVSRKPSPVLPFADAAV